MATFMTDNGLELHIKPVSTGAVQSLLGSSDVLLQMLRADGFQVAKATMTDQDIVALLKDFEPLANYCIGWGVTDDPPEEALADLETLGIKPRSKREARIRWLRLIELEQEDLGRLVGRILSMSLNDESENAVPALSDEDVVQEREREAELEMLRARVAELEGDK